MITQYEVPELLATKMPYMPAGTIPEKPSLRIYAAVNNFSDFTRHAVIHHHFGIARKCFHLADQLYAQGDALVRMLIENCFIYTFTSFTAANSRERIWVKTHVPPRLYSIYINQLMRSGC